MLVYTTREAIEEMAGLLQGQEGKTDTQLAEEFGKVIAERVAATGHGPLWQNGWKPVYWKTLRLTRRYRSLMRFRPTRRDQKWTITSRPMTFQDTTRELAM